MFAFALVALLIGGALAWWKFAKHRETPPATPVQHAKKFAETPAPKPTPALPPLLEPEAQVFARYAGSQSCRECHAAQFESWRSSNHAYAERAVSAAMDTSAFYPGQSFHHGTQQSAGTHIGEQFVVKTLGFGGAYETYIPERVIGRDPLRQFLIERAGGRFQTL